MSSSRREASEHVGEIRLRVDAVELAPVRCDFCEQLRSPGSIVTKRSLADCIVFLFRFDLRKGELS